MITDSPKNSRALQTIEHDADFVIVGGGLSGACAAIAAARHGLNVVLIQDRPIPGGNSSSEVRLWVLGATVHMTTNNRWAREGGIINEIMIENVWRNPGGNPVIWDTILLEKLATETRITLLLNTACHACEKHPDDETRITSVTTFNAQTSTQHIARAPLFCDASGDGILGFLAGAAFRMGAEPREEFDEAFARSDDFGHLLGHSIYFQSRDVGHPVPYVVPSFALKGSEIESKIPRHKHISGTDHGCHLWWLEWGGRLDTIHDTEKIKWELWRVTYGIWDYIKNSGKFPEAKNLALDWVGLIPGKRESRRFEGDYMLSQKDIVGRRNHPDAVAYGGWSIDLHPADGLFAPVAGSHHVFPKGVYSIPYRCYYSRNINNLFLAGRIISATHVAFGSTRVMCTCAIGGQVVGTAAALCKKLDQLPRALGRGDALARLQRQLLRDEQHIPAIPLRDPEDLVQQAAITASSEHIIGSLPADADAVPLDCARAQLFPLQPGPAPRITITLDADSAVEIHAELRTTSDPNHHTPDVTLAARTLVITKGIRQAHTLDFSDITISENCYAFLILRPAAGVRWHTTTGRVSGMLALRNWRAEKKTDVGGEEYEVFRADRRPDGRNFALRFDPPLRPYAPANILNGYHRPTNQTNTWVAADGDLAPAITLSWPESQTISHIRIGLDADYEHPMETVVYKHPERAVPFCAKDIRVLADDGRPLAEIRDNHQGWITITLPSPVSTKTLSIEILATHGAPAAITQVRAYASAPAL